MFTWVQHSTAIQAVFWLRSRSSAKLAAGQDLAQP
jgi:hypothetical protein